MAEPQEQYDAGLADRLSQPAQLLGWRTLRGASGRRYAFGVLDLEGELPPAGAIYCHAQRTAHPNGINRTELLRIGQTDNLAALSARSPARFNTLCVYLEDTELRRRQILRDVTSEPSLGLRDPSARRPPAVGRRP